MSLSLRYRNRTQWSFQLSFIIFLLRGATEKTKFLKYEKEKAKYEKDA